MPNLSALARLANAAKAVGQGGERVAVIPKGAYEPVKARYADAYKSIPSIEAGLERQGWDNPELAALLTERKGDLRNGFYRYVDDNPEMSSLLEAPHKSSNVYQWEKELNEPMTPPRGDMRAENMRRLNSEWKFEREQPKLNFDLNEGEVASPEQRSELIKAILALLAGLGVGGVAKEEGSSSLEELDARYPAPEMGISELFNRAFQR